jgi:hypothetical protein
MAEEANNQQQPNPEKPAAERLAELRPAFDRLHGAKAQEEWDKLTPKLENGAITFTADQEKQHVADVERVLAEARKKAVELGDAHGELRVKAGKAELAYNKENSREKPDPKSVESRFKTYADARGEVEKSRNELAGKGEYKAFRDVADRGAEGRYDNWAHGLGEEEKKTMGFTADQQNAHLAGAKLLHEDIMRESTGKSRMQIGALLAIPVATALLAKLSRKEEVDKETGEKTGKKKMGFMGKIVVAVGLVATALVGYSMYQKGVIRPDPEAVTFKDKLTSTAKNSVRWGMKPPVPNAPVVGS